LVDRPSSRSTTCATAGYPFLLSVDLLCRDDLGSPQCVALLLLQGVVRQGFESKSEYIFWNGIKTKFLPDFSYFFTANAIRCDAIVMGGEDRLIVWKRVEGARKE